MATDTHAFLTHWIAQTTGTAPAALTASTPLLEGGVLDSLKIMELLMALEAEYGLEVPLEEVIAENFDTIDAIAAMMARLA